MVNKRILLIIGIILITILISSFAVARFLPSVNAEIIETNKRIIAYFSETSRNYPLDIRTQLIYDKYGRIIDNKNDLLEDAIKNDIDEINKPIIKEEIINE